MSHVIIAPRRWTTRCVPPTRRAMRVLVVDDNSNSADALAAYLGSEDKKVLAVYGGRAAIAATCVWKPDIVLLDISMPDIDGFAVARALRSYPPTAAVVIVALTAHDETFVKRNAVEADFDAYCQKGLMLDALTFLLSSLKLSHHRSSAARALQPTV